ncbi:MAG: hypothetical protein OEW27_11085 [Aquincola sp.]|nr:hypothetical protein [Aquincola sp.]
MVDAQGRAHGERADDVARLPSRAGVRWITALAASLALGSAAGFLLNERQQELASAADVGASRAARLVDDLQGTLAVAEIALMRLESKLDALPHGAGLDDGLYSRSWPTSGPCCPACRCRWRSWRSPARATRRWCWRR